MDYREKRLEESNECNFIRKERHFAASSIRNIDRYNFNYSVHWPTTMNRDERVGFSHNKAL